ncbi:LysM peptidoglycan-binding domain-containing protein [Parasporobacterium paucivorans]|uniref:Peptidoglycan/xylan/chitin deacetylase, PgdA/CDA1 family n=1 Tax=Parasporobacterium paucivorans DSM 15970 TaxID=1122934 RepID=A0A1M6KZU3_9FIRM|nr:LysM peptidoglycan-binding domain-containing protein [Parasporobacterium paucivorans]SHJ64508.1 Peptidoglycan/xylan/chitin deacetylase, PgdA/CDA1 family [Parasporobacterium paucivorans DSM 15970]
MRKFIVLLSGLIILTLILPSQIFAAEPSQLITKGSTSGKMVALTFDDGDDGGSIPEILQILSANGIKATFFLTGKAVSHHPEWIQAIVNQGHAIGNHSYSHPYFTQLTAEQMRAELDQTEAIVRNYTGQSTKPLFRPPYGAYNSTILQVVGDAGYTKTIYWTIDTLDWKGISASEITQRVLGNITPGAIVLMHVGSGAVNTPTALPGIISSLKASGYQFVTVPQILAGAAGAQTYVVKSGDTLWKISTMYGVSIQQIVVANNIMNANLIYVGQVLTIPGTVVQPPVTPSTGTSYTVKSGDTLTRIAGIYRVTVQQLVTANNIVNANLIYVGQVLVIPGTGSPSVPVTPSTGKTYTVKSGDTLWKISTLYGVTIQAIASANSITNVNLIYVNQVLVIP